MKHFVCLSQVHLILLVMPTFHYVFITDGKFCCLEFSRINGTLKPFYDLYSFQIIPVMGQILAGDYNSYKYLVESIRVFPDQEAFAKMIQEVGFQRVTYENLTFGVCAIHTGVKL